MCIEDVSSCRSVQTQWKLQIKTTCGTVLSWSLYLVFIFETTLHGKCSFGSNEILHHTTIFIHFIHCIVCWRACRFPNRGPLNDKVDTMKLNVATQI